jgi:hypothetical protein
VQRLAGVLRVAIAFALRARKLAGDGGLNISLMPRGTIQGTRDSVDQMADGGAEDFPMNTSDRFLRFAAECEVMAKFSRTPENRAVWSGLAKRWIRCAKLMDRQDSESHSRRFLKRYPKAVYSSAH